MKWAVVFLFVALLAINGLSGLQNSDQEESDNAGSPTVLQRGPIRHTPVTVTDDVAEGPKKNQRGGDDIYNSRFVTSGNEYRSDTNEHFSALNQEEISGKRANEIFKHGADNVRYTSISGTDSNDFIGGAFNQRPNNPYSINADQGIKTGKYLNGARAGIGHQDGDLSDVLNQGLNKPPIVTTKIVYPGTRSKKYVNRIAGGDNIDYVAETGYPPLPNEYLSGLLSQARDAVEYSSGTANPGAVPDNYEAGILPQEGITDEYAIVENQEANAKYLSDILTQAQRLLKYRAVPNNVGVAPAHYHPILNKKTPIYRRPNHGIRFYDAATGSYMANPSSAVIDDEGSFSEDIPGYVIPTGITPGFNSYLNRASYYRPSGPGYVLGPERTAPTTIFGRNPEVFNLGAPIFTGGETPANNDGNGDETGVLFDKTLANTGHEIVANENKNEGTSRGASETVINKDKTKYGTRTFIHDGRLKRDGTTTIIDKDLTSKTVHATRHEDSNDESNRKTVDGAPIDKTLQRNGNNANNGKIHESLTKVAEATEADNKYRTSNNRKSTVVDETTVVGKDIDDKKDLIVTIINGNNDDSDGVIKNDNSDIIEYTTVIKNTGKDGTDNDKKDETTKTNTKVTGTNHENIKQSESVVTENTSAINTNIDTDRKDNSNNDKTVKTTEKVNKSDKIGNNDGINKQAKSDVIDKNSNVKNGNKDKTIWNIKNGLGEVSDDNDGALKDGKSVITKTVPGFKEDLSKDDDSDNKSAVIENTEAINANTDQDGKDKVKEDKTVKTIEEDTGKDEKPDALGNDKDGMIKQDKSTVIGKTTVIRIPDNVGKDTENEDKTLTTFKKDARTNDGADVDDNDDDDDEITNIDKTAVNTNTDKVKEIDDKRVNTIEKDETSEITGNDNDLIIKDGKFILIKNPVNDNEKEKKTVKTIKRVTRTNGKYVIDNDDERMTKTDEFVGDKTTAAIKNTDKDGQTNNKKDTNVKTISKGSGKDETESDVNGGTTKTGKIIATKNTDKVTTSNEEEDTRGKTTERGLTKDDESDGFKNDEIKQGGKFVVTKTTTVITKTFKDGSDKEIIDESSTDIEKDDGKDLQDNDDEISKGDKSRVTIKGTGTKSIEKGGSKNGKESSVVDKISQTKNDNSEESYEDQNDEISNEDYDDDEYDDDYDESDELKDDEFDENKDKKSTENNRNTKQNRQRNGYKTNSATNKNDETPKDGKSKETVQKVGQDRLKNDVEDNNDYDDAKKDEPTKAIKKVTGTKDGSDESNNDDERITETDEFIVIKNTDKDGQTNNKKDTTVKTIDRGSGNDEKSDVTGSDDDGSTKTGKTIVIKDTDEVGKSNEEEDTTVKTFENDETKQGGKFVVTKTTTVITTTYKDGSDKEIIDESSTDIEKVDGKDLQDNDDDISKGDKSRVTITETGTKSIEKGGNSNKKESSVIDKISQTKDDNSEESNEDQNDEISNEDYDHDEYDDDNDKSDELIKDDKLDENKDNKSTKNDGFVKQNRQKNGYKTNSATNKNDETPKDGKSKETVQKVGQDGLKNDVQDNNDDDGNKGEPTKAIKKVTGTKDGSDASDNDDERITEIDEFVVIKNTDKDGQTNNKKDTTVKTINKGSGKNEKSDVTGSDDDGSTKTGKTIVIKDTDEVGKSNEEEDTTVKTFENDETKQGGKFVVTKTTTVITTTYKDGSDKEIIDESSTDIEKVDGKDLQDNDDDISKGDKSRVTITETGTKSIEKGGNSNKKESSVIDKISQTKDDNSEESNEDQNDEISNEDYDHDEYDDDNDKSDELIKDDKLDENKDNKSTKNDGFVKQNRQKNGYKTNSATNKNDETPKDGKSKETVQKVGQDGLKNDVQDNNDDDGNKGEPTKAIKKVTGTKDGSDASDNDDERITEIDEFVVIKNTDKDGQTNNKKDTTVKTINKGSGKNEKSDVTGSDDDGSTKTGKTIVIKDTDEVGKSNEEEDTTVKTIENDETKQGGKFVVTKTTTVITKTYRDGDGKEVVNESSTDIEKDDGKDLEVNDDEISKGDKSRVTIKGMGAKSIEKGESKNGKESSVVDKISQTKNDNSEESNEHQTEETSNEDYDHDEYDDDNDESDELKDEKTDNKSTESDRIIKRNKQKNGYKTNSATNKNDGTPKDGKSKETVQKVGQDEFKNDVVSTNKDNDDYDDEFDDEYDDFIRATDFERTSSKTDKTSTQKKYHKTNTVDSLNYKSSKNGHSKKVIERTDQNEDGSENSDDLSNEEFDDGDDGSYLKWRDSEDDEIGSDESVTNDGIKDKNNVKTGQNTKDDDKKEEYENGDDSNDNDYDENGNDDGESGVSDEDVKYGRYNPKNDKRNDYKSNSATSKNVGRSKDGKLQVIIKKTNKYENNDGDDSSSEYYDDNDDDADASGESDEDSTFERNNSKIDKINSEVDNLERKGQHNDRKTSSIDSAPDETSEERKSEVITKKAGQDENNGRENDEPQNGDSSNNKETENDSDSDDDADDNDDSRDKSVKDGKSDNNKDIRSTKIYRVLEKEGQKNDRKMYSTDSENNEKIIVIIRKSGQDENNEDANDNNSKDDKTIDKSIRYDESKRNGDIQDKNNVKTGQNNDNTDNTEKSKNVDGSNNRDYDDDSDASGKSVKDDKFGKNDNIKDKRNTETDKVSDDSSDIDSKSKVTTKQSVTENSESESESSNASSSDLEEYHDDEGKNDKPNDLNKKSVVSGSNGSKKYKTLPKIDKVFRQKIDDDDSTDGDDDVKNNKDVHDNQLDKDSKFNSRETSNTDKTTNTSEQKNTTSDSNNEDVSEIKDTETGTTNKAFKTRKPIRSKLAEITITIQNKSKKPKSSDNVGTNDFSGSKDTVDFGSRRDGLGRNRQGGYHGTPIIIGCRCAAASKPKQSNTHPRRCIRTKIYAPKIQKQEYKRTVPETESVSEESLAKEGEKAINNKRPNESKHTEPEDSKYTEESQGSEGKSIKPGQNSASDADKSSSDSFTEVNYGKGIRDLKKDSSSKGDKTK